MKNKIKLLVVFLAIIPLLFSCSVNGENNTIIDNTPEADYSISENEYFIKDGKTEYIIVKPENSDMNENIAVDELILFFEEATGIKLNYISDREYIQTKNNSLFFSIGHTQLLDNSEIKIKDLKSDSFQIITKGKNVYMFGNSSSGTLYSVYEFLHKVLNFEVYYTDCYSLEKNIKNLNLYNFNLIEIPDIPYRTCNYGYFYDNPFNLARMRLKGYLSTMVQVKGSTWHNSKKYVADYVSGHESFWYSDNQLQLCYTAHGNEEEYKAMLEACFNTLKNELIADTDNKIVTMTIEDFNTFCNCEACLKIKGQYGANSALVILFCNDLNAKVKKWFGTEEGKPYARDLEIIFFAYCATEAAPATFNNSTGKWEANCGIKCDDGVSVFCAPINADFMKPLQHKDNISTYDNIEAWSAISDKIYMWIYSATFLDYMIPYDTFNSMQKIYQYLVEKNVQWLFDQAQFDISYGGLCWSTLKGYLNAKLAWNCNVDIKELTVNFFENYYGRASTTMYELFRNFRTHCAYIAEFEGYGGVMSCYMNNLNEKQWPKQVLFNWMDYYDQAISDIEYLKKVDLEEYGKIYDRIANERLSTLYLIVKLYTYNTPAETITEYKQLFKEDAQRTGITRYAEGGVMSDFLTMWDTY